MKILAFDTSTRFLSISLLEDREARIEFHEEAGIRHSEILMPTVKKMMKDLGWKAKELELVCVGLGPGSFTGMRIANATAKGLAAALGSKVAGVSSMDAMAANIPDGERFIAPLLDARKGKVYSCIYERGARGAQRTTDHLLLTVDDLLGSLDKNVFFFGDAVAKYEEKLKASRLVTYDAGVDWYPRATNIGLMGFARSKTSTDDPETLEPLYLHAKECNITCKKS